MAGKCVKKACFAVFLLILVSCDAVGGNCPLTPPSCCYNAMFGCGTFDLPDGCKCSYYGLAYHPPIQVQNAVQQTDYRKVSINLGGSSRTGLSGTWGGALDRKESSCRSFNRRVSGLIQVRESRGGVVKVTVSGYGTLKGKTTRGGYNASGSYKVPFSSCSAGVTVSQRNRRAGLAQATAKINYLCGKNSCSAVYSGILQKR